MGNWGSNCVGENNKMLTGKLACDEVCAHMLANMKPQKCLVHGLSVF